MGLCYPAWVQTVIVVIIIIIIIIIIIDKSKRMFDIQNLHGMCWSQIVVLSTSRVLGTFVLDCHLFVHHKKVYMRHMCVGKTQSLYNRPYYCLFLVLQNHI